MRLGYFGGSFDPPHLGHLEVARAARDRFALDRVLLAPTARQPLKPTGPQASFDDRLHMTGLLCAADPALEPSAIDGPQPHGQPNYTADTLRRLRSAFAGAPPPSRSAPQADSLQIFAIVGADAFAGLRQWRDPDQLLTLADWIVVSRPGSPLSPLHPLGFTPAQLARVHPLAGVANPISATEVRARLRAGLDCQALLPSAVLDFIRVRGLYQP